MAVQISKTNNNGMVVEAILANNAPMSMKDITTKCGITKNFAAVYTAINRLVDYGILAKESSADRNFIFAIAEGGIDLYEDCLVAEANRVTAKAQKEADKIAKKEAREAKKEAKAIAKAEKDKLKAEKALAKANKATDSDGPVDEDADVIDDIDEFDEEEEVEVVKELDDLNGEDEDIPLLDEEDLPVEDDDDIDAILEDEGIDLSVID